MIRPPEFDPFRERYAALPLEGLTITAVLSAGSAILQYNPLYLDGLLGAAVVRLATAGRGLPDTPDAYDIPLPLACLWRSPEGHPLWAASCFYPSDEWAQDVVYLHKRAPSGRWSRAPGGKPRPLRLVTSMGRDMERRVPMPAVTAWEFSARAIGHAAAVAELLETIVHLGKRRNLGTAHVLHWNVQPRDWDAADVLLSGGALSRAVPAAAIHLLPAAPAEPPGIVGWTPPQWKAALFADGWRAGTEIAP